jgi:hypothetical protein
METAKDVLVKDCNLTKLFSKPSKFCTCLSNVQSQIRFSVICLHHEAIPVFLKDLSWDACCSVCFLFTYVMQLHTQRIYILLTIWKSTDPLNLSKDWNLLQPDINSIQNWCTAICMKLSISKTKILSFSRNTNTLIYDYRLWQSFVMRTDSIKDLRIFLYSNFVPIMTLTTYFPVVLSCDV